MPGSTRGCSAPLAPVGPSMGHTFPFAGKLLVTPAQRPEPETEPEV